MEKKTMMIAFAMVVLLFAASTDRATSDAFDCNDACSTACVNRDPRLSARCNRKCEIRCGPAVAALEANGHLR